MLPFVAAADPLAHFSGPFSVTFLLAAMFAALGFMLAGYPNRRVLSGFATSVGLLCSLWLVLLSFGVWVRYGGGQGCVVLLFGLLPLLACVIAFIRAFSPARFADRRWVLFYSVSLMAGFLVYSATAPTKMWARSSKSSAIANDLRLIDSAVNQYAMEYNLTAGTTVTWDQIKPYLKPPVPTPTPTPPQQ